MTFSSNKNSRAYMKVRQFISLKAEIWNADCYSILKFFQEQDVSIQLSSTRQARALVSKKLHASTVQNKNQKGFHSSLKAKVKHGLIVTVSWENSTEAINYFSSSQTKREKSKFPVDFLTMENIQTL